MSSGSYFPPPVRRVEIPKADGGSAHWEFRRSQTVSPRRWSAVPGAACWNLCSTPTRTGIGPAGRRSTPCGTARQRCWRYDWVLDIDIKGFFDSIDWELLLGRSVKHTDCPWVLLYIERWLKAPVQDGGRHIEPRTGGTPQGGVISPLLANLFLHYAFDVWMARTYPRIPFERYADDIICHCKSADGGAGGTERAC